MLKKIAFVLSVVALFASCSLYSNVDVENDNIMRSKRVTYKNAFSNNETNEQEYYQELTFLKEVDRNNSTTYTLFDVITLPIESFELEDDIYIVIDEYVEELPTQFINSYQSEKINKKTDTILAIDSTKHTVITGYDVVNKKTIQMKHHLSKNLIDKLAKARKKVCLRYYVGPNKINTEIKWLHLKDLKKWLRE